MCMNEQDITVLNERFNIGIYPDVSSDGIGTYIKGINRYLKVSVVPCANHLLSPQQFLRKVPENFDLLHVPHFVVPLQRRHSKIVCTIQDITPLVFKGGLNPGLTLYLKFRIYWSIRVADYLIFTSTNTYNDVVRMFGPVRKYSIIPLGVDNPVPPHQIPQLEYPFRFFFCVGRRRPHKNITRILKAFAMVAEKLDCHLIFGGKEDIKDSEYQALSAKLGIKDRIHYTGFLTLEELAAHYHASIALIFSSLYEGFGLPILEAMSYGCPVITSNLSSMPEIAGDAALLVDPYDMDSIVHAMHRIAQDSNLREDLVQKGYANVKRFSWELTANRTAAVYSKVLSGF